ncbi:DUF7855 family protein [Halomicrobium katesii]|uniref:DUF7855 family protein n=1 Tax=Halomicrobium katesii TaxID=437163 RepID=UPI00036B9AF3|nr:hypothetical protein [Halomicrobium katesii]
MFLVITYSRSARSSLRNVTRAHEETTVRQFGRAALLAGTAFGAFQACRLREKHGRDVQVERVEPFVPADVPADVRDAAEAYEDRDQPSVPYRQFSAGTDHPGPSALRERDL